jgi:D-serine deaminase-like pyridoxal phosphate-dependent protein
VNFAEIFIMFSFTSQVGLHKNELDTPALILDLDVMQRNVRYMRDYFRYSSVKLRPHVKLHRATPELAFRQMTEGTNGLTCSKLGEAEILVAAGIKDVLIANQIVGTRKIQRLMNLASQAKMMVAVDNAQNILELSKAARANSVTLRVLVEVNIGHNRCGVAPYAPALTLAKLITGCANLQFAGLMAYDGHCTIKIDSDKREAKSLEANRLLVETRQLIESAGIPVAIVSASGTFTYRYATKLDGITEIQAGTYLLMDTMFREKGVTEFECALSVLATVTSRPSYEGAEMLAIIDVGRKSIETGWGLPEVLYPSCASIASMSQEHGRLHLTENSEPLQVGDKVELAVRDASNTINLYDQFYVVRGGIVEAVWTIPGRGRST